MNEHPALAIVEFSSIAVGTRATDALMKKSPVTLRRVGSFQPGRFAALFTGQVAEVDEAFVEALRVGAEALTDRLMLADIEPTVFGATLGKSTAWTGGDCLAVIESSTLAGVIEASDAAVKGAAVRIIQMRLGDGLGGKGVAHLIGEQHDIEAAVEIGSSRAARPDRVIHTSIIPRLDDEVRAMLSGNTRFNGGDR